MAQNSITVPSLKMDIHQDIGQKMAVNQIHNITGQKSAA